MKGYMYILECIDDSFYVGSTYDLIMRFDQHQKGEGSNYTKVRLPVKLIYYEEFNTVKEAFQREKQIQGWTKAKKIALMKKNIKKLELLAQCQNHSHYKNYNPDSNTSGQSDFTKKENN
jgi:putative endonuclease